MTLQNTDMNYVKVGLELHICVVKGPGPPANCELA